MPPLSFGMKGEMPAFATPALLATGLLVAVCIVVLVVYIVKKNKSSTSATENALLTSEVKSSKATQDADDAQVALDAAASTGDQTEVDKADQTLQTTASTAIVTGAAADAAVANHANDVITQEQTSNTTQAQVANTITAVNQRTQDNQAVITGAVTAIATTTNTTVRTPVEGTRTTAAGMGDNRISTTGTTSTVPIPGSTSASLGPGAQTGTTSSSTPIGGTQGGTLIGSTTAIPSGALRPTDGPMIAPMNPILEPYGSPLARSLVDQMKRELSDLQGDLTFITNGMVSVQKAIDTQTATIRTLASRVPPSTATPAIINDYKVAVFRANTDRSNYIAELEEMKRMASDLMQEISMQKDKIANAEAALTVIKTAEADNQYLADRLNVLVTSRFNEVSRSANNKINFLKSRQAAADTAKKSAILATQTKIDGLLRIIPTTPIITSAVNTLRARVAQISSLITLTPEITNITNLLTGLKEQVEKTLPTALAVCKTRGDASIYGELAKAIEDFRDLLVSRYLAAITVPIFPDMTMPMVGV